MPSQLCLSVTFLDPSFHGRGDGAEPEWPPSPLRLFQALVAAAHAASRHEASLSDRTVAALRWLEQQPAPVIVAPAGRLSQAYRLSVPNNAMDVVAGAWSRGNETGKDANPATHRAMKMVEGTSLVDGDTVHYLWPLPEPLTNDIRDLADSLSCVAQNLVAFGWGIDLAIGCGRIITDSENEDLSGERWFPTRRGRDPGPRCGKTTIIQNPGPVTGEAGQAVGRGDEGGRRPPFYFPRRHRPHRGDPGRRGRRSSSAGRAGWFHDHPAIGEAASRIRVRWT